MKEIYDFKEIEKEVQNLWARNKRYEANIDTTKPKILLFINVAISFRQSSHGPRPKLFNRRRCIKI